MKKLITLLLLSGLLFIESVKSQPLVNVFVVQSFEISQNETLSVSDAKEGSLIVAWDKNKVKVFENNNMSCWVEYKYKTCGQRVKLSKRTIVELKNGEVYKGRWKTDRSKITEDDPGYFIGFYSEEFDMENNNSLSVSFDYTFRYKSPVMAYK